MLSTMRLVQLGDLEVTLPAAAAVSASLVASRLWRMAACWLLLFMAGIGLVGASKIAFLGWGTGWQAVCFKAISGHATGATAVFPMLFFLLLQGCSAPVRQAGVIAGLGLGTLVAVLLVLLGEHSGAEALAGWTVGATISLVAIRLADGLPPLRPLPSAVSFALAFALGVWLMQSVPVGWWMIKTARLLSGKSALFPLD